MEIASAATRNAILGFRRGAGEREGEGATLTHTHINR